MPSRQPLASNLSVKNYGPTRVDERADMAHRKRLRRGVLILLVILLGCAVIGYWTAHAQEKSFQNNSLAIQVALNTQQISQLSQSQTDVIARMDTLTSKVDDLSGTLSTMKGIGTGFAALLGFLQVVAIFIQLGKRKIS